MAQNEVVINGEIFYLDTIPRADSKLVIEANNGLSNEIDLQTLVEELDKLGSFMRVAYNGVAGNTELQIKVQRVGYKITKLVDRIAVTVDRFKVTSRNILQELQGTYEYLLDCQEEMAVVTLSGLAQVAEIMAKAAEELHKEFDVATIDVIDALEATQRKQGFQESKKKEMEKEREKFEIKIKEAEELQEDAMEAERQAEKYYNEAQRREDEAFDLQTSALRHVFDSIVQVLQTTVSVRSINPSCQEIRDNTYKEAMKRAAEEKKKHLEDMQNQRCIEFTERIKNCRDDESLAQVAIDALQYAVGAQKSLSTIMMKAAVFWRQMQNRFEDLTSEKLQRSIKTAMKLKEERRIKVWTSPTFKESAIHCYCKWVAMYDICSTYMLQIKETRSDLYSYLQENPTIEQSRRNVRTLAIEFKNDLDKAQRAIAEKSTQSSIFSRAISERTETFLIPLVSRANRTAVTEFTPTKGKHLKRL